MKYTTLFSTVALAAAMSMRVSADPAQVAADNFDSYQLGGAEAVAVKDIQAFGDHGWAVGGEDASEIVATHFDNGGQALKLNTNGETLSLPAVTTENFTATVSMKVEMVASDTVVDMSNDTTTQTAVFLLKEDEEAAAGVLMAFSYDAQEGNKWVQLTADGFALDNGDTADISIVIDYTTEKATYTVNGTTFDAIALANPTAAAAHKLSSVAFKGTGYVDDLFVGAEQTGTFATFIYEIAGVPQGNPQSKNISAAAFTPFSSYVEPQTGSNTVAVLYSRTEGVDTEMATLTLTDDTWSITDPTQFEEGGTYVVKVTFELKSVTVNIVDDNDTAIDTITSYKWFEPFSYTLPAGASIEGWSVGADDYEAEDPIAIASLEADVVTIVLHGYVAGQTAKTWTTADVVANSFSWTGYDPAAGTATFTCTLSGTPAQGDTFGAFTVTTATVLGGSTTDQAVTVTPDLTALPTLTGTVSGLPTNGTGLFLLGVKDAVAAPAAGGE